MGKKDRSIRRIENLGKFAVYTHYQDIKPSEEADELFRSGSIYVPVVDIGWIWIIPLSGRRLSVGLVVQKERPKDCEVEELLRRYLDAIRANPGRSRFQLFQYQPLWHALCLLW